MSRNSLAPKVIQRRAPMILYQPGCLRQRSPGPSPAGPLRRKCVAFFLPPLALSAAEPFAFPACPARSAEQSRAPFVTRPPVVQGSMSRYQTVEFSSCRSTKRVLPYNWCIQKYKNVFASLHCFMAESKVRGWTLR